MATRKPSLTWTITERRGCTTVALSGTIDEDVDFAELAELKGPLVFDLEHVQGINSCGVREWIQLLRGLGVVELSFVRCSATVVRQLNMIRNFRGTATVRSIVAPYYCPGCTLEVEKLLDVEECFPGGVTDTVPAFGCPSCDAPLEFDAIPEQYLLFLKT